MCFMIKTSSAKPFVRWAGGKRQIVKQIIQLLPITYEQYYEPFLGGGALFFALDLKGKKVTLNDLNPYLIGAYNFIKNSDSLSKLIPKLKKFQNQNSSEFYYLSRNIFNSTTNFNKKITIFFYLNKVCFNGLYRENDKGLFNVPYNNNFSKELFDFVNINKVHEYLNFNQVNILNQDYKMIFKNAKKNDFVYFDPPYDSPNIPKSFTKYNSQDFMRAEQLALRNLCVSLTKKGIKVMVSNHNTDFIREIYSEPIFNLKEITAVRVINSNGTKRGKVKELLIRNYL